MAKLTRASQAVLGDKKSKLKLNREIQTDLIEREFNNFLSGRNKFDAYVMRYEEVKIITVGADGNRKRAVFYKAWLRPVEISHEIIPWPCDFADAKTQDYLIAMHPWGTSDTSVGRGVGRRTLVPGTIVSCEYSIGPQQNGKQRGLTFKMAGIGFSQVAANCFRGLNSSGQFVNASNWRSRAGGAQRRRTRSRVEFWTGNRIDLDRPTQSTKWQYTGIAADSAPDSAKEAGQVVVYNGQMPKEIMKEVPNEMKSVCGYNSRKKGYKSITRSSRADHWILADAYNDLVNMNKAFKKDFGFSLGVCSPYRSYNQQAGIQSTSTGATAVANAGSSMHGLGIAIDFSVGADPCLPRPVGGKKGYNSMIFWWLRNYAGRWNWWHPYVMRRRKPSSGSYKLCEPWHWQWHPPVGSGVLMSLQGSSNGKFLDFSWRSTRYHKNAKLQAYGVSYPCPSKGAYNFYDPALSPENMEKRNKSANRPSNKYTTGIDAFPRSPKKVEWAKKSGCWDFWGSTPTVGLSRFSRGNVENNNHALAYFAKPGEGSSPLVDHPLYGEQANPNYGIDLVFNTAGIDVALKNTYVHQWHPVPPVLPVCTAQTDLNTGPNGGDPPSYKADPPKLGLYKTVSSMKEKFHDI